MGQEPKIRQVRPFLWPSKFQMLKYLSENELFDLIQRVIVE
jgi:hypothetical protein